MENEILFYLRPGRNLHDDFIMEIPFLNKSFSFDTCYFWDGGFYTDNYERLGRLIDDYLRNCAAIVLSLDNTEVVYLPVDISDQYYGVFRVSRLDQSDFKFEYGTVDKANEVQYAGDDGRRLEVPPGLFDKDFEFNLTAEEVVDSFRLRES